MELNANFGMSKFHTPPQACSLKPLLQRAASMVRTTSLEVRSSAGETTRVRRCVQKSSTWARMGRGKGETEWRQSHSERVGSIVFYEWRDAAYQANIHRQLSDKSRSTGEPNI
jgi:hypothetical protein